MTINIVRKASCLGGALFRSLMLLAVFAACLSATGARAADEQAATKYMYLKNEITKEKFEELWERHKDQFYWCNGQITDLLAPEGIKRLKYPFEINDIGLLGFKIVEIEKRDHSVKAESEHGIAISKSVTKPVTVKIFDVGEEDGKKGDKLSMACKVLTDNSADGLETPELVALKKISKTEFKKYLDDGFGLYIYKDGKKRVDR